jgi:gamma-glutamyltranspeptidase
VPGKYPIIIHRSILSDVFLLTGSCQGWIDTLKLFGSGKLTLSEILEPAIRLAEEGAPISELTSFFVRLEHPFNLKS